MMELKKTIPLLINWCLCEFLPNYILSIFFLGKKKTWDKTNSELNQFDSHISLFREYRGHLLRLHVSMLRLMDLILKSVLQQRKLIFEVLEQLTFLCRCLLTVPEKNLPLAFEKNPILKYLNRWLFYPHPVELLIKGRLRYVISFIKLFSPHLWRETTRITYKYKQNVRSVLFKLILKKLMLKRYLRKVNSLRWEFS